MSFDTTPGDGPALMRALHQHHLGQLREATEARHRHRLLTAAGIDPDRLSEGAQRTLAELCGADAPTIEGLVEILLATRTAAQMAIQREELARKVQALRESEAATEAAMVRFDDQQEARRHGRR
jgi:hypothetical protein